MLPNNYWKSLYFPSTGEFDNINCQSYLKTPESNYASHKLLKLKNI